jgi:hypothetical protein
MSTRRVVGRTVDGWLLGRGRGVRGVTGCVHGVSSGGTIDKFELLNALDRLGKTTKEVHPALRRLSCRSAPSRSRDAALRSYR